MRVKICGVTTAEDARFIEDAGADAIGVVISEESERYVPVSKAAEIFGALGPFVSKVVVTHTKSKDVLDDIISLKPNAIQISTGLEMPPDFSGQVIRVIEKNSPFPKDCDAVIIDSSRGRGIEYDLSFAKEIVKSSDKPVILAGGLNAANVGFATDNVRPYAVDVCSGVEEKPGIKNRFAVLEFMRACGKIPGLRLKEKYVR